jgi:hypothetical protein
MMALKLGVVSERGNAMNMHQLGKRSLTRTTGAFITLAVAVVILLCSCTPRTMLHDGQHIDVTTSANGYWTFVTVSENLARPLLVGYVIQHKKPVNPLLAATGIGEITFTGKVLSVRWSNEQQGITFDTAPVEAIAGRIVPVDGISTYKQNVHVKPDNGKLWMTHGDFVQSRDWGIPCGKSVQSGG